MNLFLRSIIFLSLFCYSIVLKAQTDDPLAEDIMTNRFVFATFKTSRLCLSHTIEQPKLRELDVRITHRFDDMATKNSAETLLGIDNVTDIRIAFEFGITDKLCLGIGRSKGVYGHRGVLDGFVKYKILEQSTDNKTPFALSFLLNTTLSTRKSINDSTSELYFTKFAHRMSYTMQIILARKFSDKFSCQILPTFLHRNKVHHKDNNAMFAIGFGSRLKVSRSISLIADYYYSFNDYLQNTKDNSGVKQFYNPLGLGVEIETGGHVFQINFTNSKGIIENQFLPYTTDNWAKGQFRIGFTISRMFNI